MEIRNKIISIFRSLIYDGFASEKIERISQLINLIEKSPIKFKFIIEIRVDVINRISIEILEKMMIAGFIEFNLGLEKGTDAALQYFQKHITTQDQRSAILKLRKVSAQIGIPIIINGTFILGGPDEKLMSIIN